MRPDGSNPRKHIKKYPEAKRERYFSAAELQSIGRVLHDMEEERIELQSAIAAIRLLLFTGAASTKSLPCSGSMLTKQLDYSGYLTLKSEPKQFR